MELPTQNSTTHMPSAATTNQNSGGFGGSTDTSILSSSLPWSPMPSFARKPLVQITEEPVPHVLYPPTETASATTIAATALSVQDALLAFVSGSGGWLGGAWAAVVGLGVLANALVVVMVAARRRDLSALGLLLALVAVNDALALALSLPGALQLMGVRIGDGDGKVHVEDTHVGVEAVGLCAARWLAAAAGTCAAPWLAAALAAERVVAICFPLQRIAVCTPAKAAAAGGAVLAVTYGANLAVMAVNMVGGVGKKGVGEAEAAVGVNGTVRLLPEEDADWAALYTAAETCPAYNTWMFRTLYAHVAGVTLAPLALLAAAAVALGYQLRRRVRQMALFENSADMSVAVGRLRHNNGLACAVLAMAAKVALTAAPVGLFAVWFHHQYHGDHGDVLVNLTAAAADSTGNLTAAVQQTPISAPGSSTWDSAGRALLVRDVLTLLSLAGAALTGPVLLLAPGHGGRYFRRTLYQTMCWQRANIDADLTQPAPTSRIRDRLDPIAALTRRRRWGRTNVRNLHVNSRLCSMRVEHEKRNMKIVAEQEKERELERRKGRRGRLSKEGSTESGRSRQQQPEVCVVHSGGEDVVEVVSLGDVVTGGGGGGGRVEVTLSASALREFNISDHKVVCEVPSTESVLHYTADRLMSLGDNIHDEQSEQ